MEVAPSLAGVLHAVAILLKDGDLRVSDVQGVPVAAQFSLSCHM